MKGFFYEIGLPSEFTENYTKLNKNEPITLFEWQEKVLSKGKPDQSGEVRMSKSGNILSANLLPLIFRKYFKWKEKSHLCCTNICWENSCIRDFSCKMRWTRTQSNSYISIRCLR